MQSFDVDDLIACYRRGVFPMAEARDDQTIFLIDPDLRGVVPLDGFHVPRRLARTVRLGPYDVRIDSAFGEVIGHCAQTGPSRAETWISHPIQDLYQELFLRGLAHSRPTRCTRAILLASRSTENMLSPKKAPPRQTP